MPKTKTKKLTVAQRNAAFEKLSPAGKRVQIARDVLERLKLGKLNAARGVYLMASDTSRLNRECTACALGAVFACAAVKGVVDRKKGMFDNMYDAESMRRALVGHFDLDQLHHIETAFEGQQINLEAPVSSEARRFNSGINDNSERMARIMRNIIHHRGTFRPEMGA